MSSFLQFLFEAIALSSPLILAAMGGYFSERSGVINIALEGNMLAGAIVAAVVGQAFHPYAGLVAGLAAGVLFSGFHWILTQTYRIDHVVSGMAINAAAFGCASVLGRRFTDLFSDEPRTIAVWPFFVVALSLPFLVSLYSRSTRGGLRLLATGIDPGKARLMGVDTTKVRLWALVATGLCCGLAGAQLISNAGYYTDGMTAGRGFIALAALILGGWRPLPTLACCLVFGTLQALQIQFQGTPIMGVEIPRELWYCLPYMAAVVAMAGIKRSARAPQGLGKY